MKVKITLPLLCLFILLIIITGIIYIKDADRDKIRRNNVQILISESYSIYSDDYSYSESKNFEHTYINMFHGSVQDEDNVKNIFNEINQINIDFTYIKDNYNNQFKSLYLYKLKNSTCNSSTPIINEGKIANSQEFISKNINPSLKAEILDIPLPEELKAYNEIQGYIIRAYYANINGFKILNLGQILLSNEYKDYWYWTIVHTFLCNDLDSYEYKVNIKNVDQLINDLISRKNILFNIDYIPEIEINDIDLSSSKITITSLDINYLYLEENSTLIPLLRLNGSLNSNGIDYKITFWTWIIE